MRPTNKLIVMVGPPGVGKSTAARAIAEGQQGLIVNLDLIVTMLHGVYTGYREELKSIYKSIEIDCVQSILLSGETAIVDRCCHKRSTRKLWIDIGHQLGVPVEALEVKCSDPPEIRARCRSTIDPRGHTYEKWVEVMKQYDAEYEPVWSNEGFNRINTKRRGE